MDVAFRTHRLERRYQHGADAIRAWGDEVGRRYVQRIGALTAASALSDLYAVRAFDLHPLRGDRAGQYAIRLTGQMRLIVTVEEEQRRVTVEEVVDYHA